MCCLWTEQYRMEINSKHTNAVSLGEQICLRSVKRSQEAWSRKTMSSVLPLVCVLPKSHLPERSGLILFLASKRRRVRGWSKYQTINLRDWRRSSVCQSQTGNTSEVPDWGKSGLDIIEGKSACPIRTAFQSSTPCEQSHHLERTVIDQLEKIMEGNYQSQILGPFIGRTSPRCTVLVLSMEKDKRSWGGWAW